MADHISRRTTTIATVGALVFLAVGCGGSKSNSAPAVSQSSSTTDAAANTHTSPTTAATHAKKPARRTQKPAPTSTPPTTAAHTRVPVVIVPTTATPADPVIAAVPPGGAAPVTLPGPSSPGTAPPTQKPHTTTTTVKPFDPTQTIDLSGTPGVSPAQQTAAENLLRATLRDVPKYANQSVAYAAGYRTIGDASTGDEHWVNWAYANDSDILDAMHPESLVYNTRTPGHPVLEATMYMLPPGSRFTNIPPLFQSPLTQFHVHNDICFAQTSDPLQKVFSGSTNGSGDCPAGTTLAGNVPMLHAWIIANRCGPFAALSGIAAGQVPAGQTPNCDTDHAGVL